MPLPASLHDRVTLLERYVRIRTLSGAIDAALVDDVRVFWRGLGIELAPLVSGQEGETPALFAEIAGRRPGPVVLLYGHYDVQPTGDLTAWRWGARPLDPWEPVCFINETVVQADKLGEDDLRRAVMLGRGAADNKGQHLANILGVLDAQAAGTLLGTVKILLDGEEERGSPSLPAIADRHRDLLRADLLIGSDGPKQNNAPTIVLGCRGLLGVELRADNGRGQSLHSGNYGNIAPNPVLPLARLLAALPERIDAVARRHGDFKRSVLAAFAEASGREAWEPFLDPTTNVNGIISEGVTPGRRRTIIPNWALATVDIRLTPDTPIGEVAQAIEDARREEMARSRDVSVTARHNWGTPPSYTPPARPEFGGIVAATRSYWGTEPMIVPLLGGTLPAYVFTEMLGMPAYWLPAAQSNNRQHDVNEHLALDHFLRQPGWYAAVLAAVAALR
ncbi:MAG TPA: M20/M25/M40 family metallo-hydrolase [Dehalococcoidia bacterium]|nr:M20/M25/M40 family metallo-hydrolase [Dehalococcoidia bacterium]